jgi:hypothetical protein
MKEKKIELCKETRLGFGIKMYCDWFSAHYRSIGTSFRYFPMDDAGATPMTTGERQQWQSGYLGSYYRNCLLKPHPR